MKNAFGRKLTSEAAANLNQIQITAKAKTASGITYFVAPDCTVAAYLGGKLTKRNGQPKAGKVYAVEKIAVFATLSTGSTEIVVSQKIAKAPKKAECVVNYMAALRDNPELDRVVVLEGTGVEEVGGEFRFDTEAAQLAADVLTASEFGMRYTGFMGIGGLRKKIMADTTKAAAKAAARDGRRERRSGMISSFKEKVMKSAEEVAAKEDKKNK